MAFSLKKWVGSQLFSAFMADYNDNMTDIETALNWGAEKTATLGNGWTGTLKYKKQNGTGLVVVEGAITSPSSAIPFRQLIATLDAGWRPKQTIAITAYSATAGRLVEGFKLGANGELKTELEVAANAQLVVPSNQYHISISYVV